MTIAPEAPVLFATATGGRKHLAQCPHVVGATTLRAIAADEELDLCDWCSKELSGHGRTYFDAGDLEGALAAFKAPIENRQLIKDALRDVEHDQIWMPYSSSYVALGRGGRGVAWTGKTYVVPEPGGSLELPGFVGASRTGGASKAEDRWGDVCLRCFHRRSVDGSCGCE